MNSKTINAEDKAFRRLILLAIIVPLAVLPINIGLVLLHLLQSLSTIVMVSSSLTTGLVVAFFSRRQVLILSRRYKESLQHQVILRSSLKDQISVERNARAEAEEAIRVRDNFLSVASHDLRNPLSALYYSVQGIQRFVRERPSLPAGQTEIAKMADMSIRQIRHMLRMMDDLMNVSQIVDGKTKIEIEDVDVTQILCEVVERMRDVFNRAECDVEFDMEGPCYVKADPIKLDQAFTNVLSNAAKYGKGKPITVSLKCGETVLISVRDHGIGVLDEDKSRIFEKFERAVSGKAYLGHGLGLWIVKGVLDKMGGTINVESPPDGGSIFHIHLVHSEIKATSTHPIMVSPEL